MKDAHPIGRLVIKKTDADSNVPLAGVEFVLKEKKTKKTVAKLITDETGTATSGDLPIALYKDGKFKENIEYVLVETKALDGYEASSEEIDILFEYQDDRKKEIEITKELTNVKVSVTSEADTPQTGDSTNIWLPILLAIISIGGITAVVWYMKKKEE